MTQIPRRHGHLIEDHHPADFPCHLFGNRKQEVILLSGFGIRSERRRCSAPSPSVPIRDIIFLYILRFLGAK